MGLLIQSNAGANDVFAVRNSGQVGIGTRSPTVSLDVRGGVRAGSDSEVTVCGNGVAGGEGTQRYNYTSHQMEYCNGSGWVPFQAGSIDWKTPDITYSRSGTTSTHHDLGSTHSKCLLAGSGTNNGGCYLFHPNQTGNPQVGKWLLSLEAYGLNTSCIVNCWN